MFTCTAAIGIFQNVNQHISSKSERYIASVMMPMALCFGSFLEKLLIQSKGKKTLL